MYTIIEDCSPYYIRFKWDGLSDVIDFVSKQPLEKIVKGPGYQTEYLSRETAIQINNMLPFKDVTPLKLGRFWIFNTYPDGGAGIHKDGYDNRISINIPLQILDDKCITGWYDDKQFKDWPVSSNSTEHITGITTRNILRDWRKAAEYPQVKTLVAKPDEAVLLNVNIYHTFWNKDSTNNRKILTLRLINNDIYFDDVKKLIFDL